MKKIITAICLPIFFIPFLTGCSSDSSDSIVGSIEENIIGKWVIIAHESENGYAEYYNTCADFKDYIEFFKDGSFAERFYSPDCKPSDKLERWELHDYRVDVYNTQNERIKSYTVTKLKGDKLTLNEGIVQSLVGKLNITTYYSRQ